MSENTPVIILVRPQIGENIGMSARAALNGGLTKLRLVNPKEPWPNPKAVKPAAGAHEILDDVEVFNSLEDSIADLHLVLATSARPRDMTKYVYNAESAIKKLYEEIQKGHKVGIMFGPERSGLDNDDLSRADGLIEIPMNPEYSSLNLAQAVLLMSYEWIKLRNLKPDLSLSIQEEELATKKELNDYLDQLETELEKAGFLRVPHKRPGMVRNIRNMFLRVGYTSQEVRTLRGMISSLANPYHKKEE